MSPDPIVPLQSLPTPSGWDSPPAPPALELSGLSVSYGGMRAIRDVSLVVPPGAVVALLGANGAGKSTTLRAISGVIRADRGQIRVSGRRIDRQPAYRISRMGVVHVPEGRGVFPNLTVRENLEMAEASPGAVGDPVGEGAALFPVLGNRLPQIAGSLSGGEQQMLALARALVTRPQVLMVDEISMGLAPIIVGQLFETLRERVASGVSLLIVEQYVEAALGMADYAYVMDKGVIVDVGQPADLRAHGLVTAYLGGAA